MSMTRRDLFRKSASLTASTVIGAVVGNSTIRFVDEALIEAKQSRVKDDPIHAEKTQSELNAELRMGARIHRGDEMHTIQVATTALGGLTGALYHNNLTPLLNLSAYDGGFNDADRARNQALDIVTASAITGAMTLEVTSGLQEIFQTAQPTTLVTIIGGIAGAGLMMHEIKQAERRTADEAIEIALDNAMDEAEAEAPSPHHI